MRPALPLLLAACAAPVPPAEAPLFVRGGVVVSGPAEGQPLPEGRTLVAVSAEPGSRLDLPGGAATVPARPSCTPIFSVDLGDAARQVALGGSAPDTALAWSDDGRLAVGTARGEVLVLDGWSGAVLARRRLSEALVKSVAWSADGDTLYAGEQSPDALLHALSPEDLASRWTLRLADRIGTSPAPAGEDLYGVYTLPGITGLDVLPGGDLLVAATHAWPTDDGRRNRAQVLRIAPDGTVRAAFPEDPAGATFLHPRLDAAAGRVIVPVGHSADGEPPEDLPVGGAVVLDLATLTPVAAAVVPPLEPWFDRTFLWEGADVDADGFVLGLGDGRVRTFDPRGGPRAVLDPGAPVLAGEVPIVAPVGHARRAGPWTLAVTEVSNIPYGAAAPDLRPPVPHPGRHTLWAWRADGTLAWSLSGPWALQGLTVAPDGASAVLGAGARPSDDRRDLFGALVVDLSDDDRPGEDRLVTVCPTAGPVFFRHAVHPDGRIAVAEVPWREGAGVTGAWRVTVLR